MLDIKRIKENPEAVKKRLAARRGDYSKQIDRLLECDAVRRALIADTESKKAEQNTVSKDIPRLKREGVDVAPVFAKMKELSTAVKADEEKLSAIDAEIRQLLLSIPNLPHDSVPDGADDTANPEILRWGTPRTFEFDPLPHWDLGAALGILDPDTAAKVTGTRFHFLKGLGARLERAIISYFLDTHTANGYTEILPPYMVNRASMTGTGQLPKFEEDAFHIESEDYFMIPTAEVPVTNMYRDDILNGAELPLRYAAYSACFRAEAGSAGRDTRGLIRQHQFDKVELVQFVRPETSYEALEALTHDAQSVLEGLGLPHRVVLLCTGDVGFSSAKTYDVEVWMPSYGRYVEISSASNFEDYQARRANIKFKDNAGDKAKFVHTLNASGVAVGRTMAAILENYQNADGSVTVPEKLRPYMGCDRIG